MSDVKVRKPSKAELEKLGTDRWNPWEHGPGSFDWEYDEDETFYVLEGKVRVETASGAVEFGKGDLVTFPKGTKCSWTVIETIRKRYRMG